MVSKTGSAGNKTVRACLKIPTDAVCLQTLRAAGLLAVGCVGSVVTARKMIYGDCSSLAALPTAKTPRRSILRNFKIGFQNLATKNNKKRKMKTEKEIIAWCETI
jgi:hypothetical protein